MIDLLADLGGLIVSPRQTFKIIFAEKRGLLQPTLILLVMMAALSLVTIANVAIRFMGLASSLIGGLGGALSAFLGLVSVAGMVIGSVILWFILGLLTHVFAKIFGGKGDVEKAFTVLGYATVSFFIYVILGFIGLFTNFLVSIGLLMVGLLVSAILWIIVASVGVSEAYGVSLGRGLASVILPLIVLSLIPLLMALPFMFTAW